MMPGLTGLDVLRILRESPATEDLPVIMATAKTDSEDIVEALELGANDYVTKPLDFPIVLARVQAQLRSRRQVRPAEPAASVVDALEGIVPHEFYSSNFASHKSCPGVTKHSRQKSPNHNQLVVEKKNIAKV